MAFIADHVLDFGLNVLDTEANALHICSSEPATFSSATGAASLGNKSGLSVGAPAARTPDGRKVTIGAIADGSVTDTGTATHYAIVDTVGGRLLAAGSLAASQAVTSGNTFTLAEFEIGIPGAA